MYFITVLLTFLSLLPFAIQAVRTRDEAPNTVINTTILILGGGMTGVSAAHSLAIDLNITDFLIVEARHELGGRVQQGQIGGLNIEFGANWVEGLGSNLIWKLVQKYGINNRYSNWSNIDYFTAGGWQGEDGSLAEAVTRYEETVFSAASADAGRRKALGLPDLSMKAGLKMNAWTPLTAEERAAEYFSHDWEQAEPPIESSFIATIEVYNETFIESGSSNNNLVIDQRGYKQVILQYGAEILNFDKRVLLNQVVETIAYTGEGVTVTTSGGLTINAEYALCTFSLGVLQHDDVTFEPELPDRKREAIANFHLATYMKIFAKFSPKFWNDTEFALYADPDERGYYTVWQSLDAPGFYEGSGIIFATLTSDAAYHAELQTDEEVQADFVAVLRDMYGSENVPDPVEFTFPRWTLDPLFRGTFTNWGAGVTVKQQEDMRAPVGGDTDPAKRLYFAGEHTSRKYFGYLHGAYWEGRMAAYNIADCVLRGCLESDSTMITKREAMELGKNSIGTTIGRHRKRQWG